MYIYIYMYIHIPVIILTRLWCPGCPAKGFLRGRGRGKRTETWAQQFPTGTYEFLIHHLN